MRREWKKLINGCIDLKKMFSYFKNLIIELPIEASNQASIAITPLSQKFNINLIENIIFEWLRLCNFGGYCLPNKFPENSKGSVKFEGFQHSRMYEWTTYMCNCDKRCLIVLANMIIDAGYVWNPNEEVVEFQYDRVQISASSEGEKLIRYDFNVNQIVYKDYHYPQVSEIMQPLVIYEDVSSVKAFRKAVLQFRNLLEESCYNKIKEITTTWSGVVESGYPRSLEDQFDGDGIIEGVSVDIFDKNSLEIKIERFGGSESAWNSLINSLGLLRSEIEFIKIY